MAIAQVGVGTLPGQGQTQERSASVLQSPESAAVLRQHPDKPRWDRAERRQRASYLATSEDLAPFLVAHRFEAENALTVAPETLNRARLGYGIGLNKAWLAEVFGHIRGAPAHYWWGALANLGAEDERTNEPPPNTVALQIWEDATMDGTTHTNFFEGDVLEWMTTSLGGFVVVDNPRGTFRNQGEEIAAGVRPYFRWVPLTDVVDLERDKYGFRWLKILEEAEVTKAYDPAPQQQDRRVFVYYELEDDGRTSITRRNAQGETVGEVVTMDRVVDRQGRAILPVRFAKFGAHPKIRWAGSGLLLGQDDIVIDLFNLLTETREAFRDSAFGLLTYKGPSGALVVSLLKVGTRFVDLGDNEKAELSRVSGDAGEVAAGLSLIDLGLRAWALSSKRKVEDQMESAVAASGVSIKAEFQLDLRPLLISVTEALDAVESDCMFIAAQLNGKSPDQARSIAVKRDTHYNLEDEASRIARLVAEVKESLPLPGALVAELIRQWSESSGLVDLDAPVLGADGKETKQTLRDLISAQADLIGVAAQELAVSGPRSVFDLGAGGKEGEGDEGEGEEDEEEGNEGNPGNE